jgi:YfiH family protein
MEVDQVHGIRVVAASSQLPVQKADGLYLHGTPGTIAVRSADCLPVLLAAPSHGLVMALHAGWRSLSAGIVREGLRISHAQGIAAKELYAVLGPTLCPAHFEVGPEVVAAFRALGMAEHDLAACVRPGARDRSHMDLGEAACRMLLQWGIFPEQISRLDSCTYCHPELWPSWRRDRKFERYVWSFISL